MTALDSDRTIDLQSPDTYADGLPLDDYDWLRANQPIYWHEEPDGPGFRVLTEIESVREVGRDPGTFLVRVDDDDPGRATMGDPDHQNLP